jgi:hypothetical protein
MRTKNCLSWFRDALTFSTLLLVLPAACPAQEADRLQLSPLRCRRRNWDRSRHAERNPFPPILV